MRMRQEIKVSVVCPDTSFNIKLMQVYRKDNTLIAISKLDSKGFAGEVITKREDAAWVEFEADKELPVKHYIVNKVRNIHGVAANYTQVKSVESIKEIAGLSTLPMEKVAGENNDEDLEVALARAPRFANK